MVGATLLAMAKDLKNATQEGRVKWSETADTDTFRIVFDYAVVKISKSYNSEFDDTFIWLVVTNPKGKTVEEVSLSQGPEYALLDELFSLARRSARNSESILEQIRKDIRPRGE